MLKNKIIVKRIRNIFILLMVMIVMLGAYRNIRRSRAENVIEISMEVADKTNNLAVQTLTLSATETSNGIYLLELPTAVNGNIVTKYYTTEDIGCFDSLAELEEATQRNPNEFKLPVVLSLKGVILRTSDDKLFLVNAEGVKERNILVHEIDEGQNISEEQVHKFNYSCQIYMINDTENRLLTKDYVQITGVYRHSNKTLSDCTYEFLNQ